MAIFISYSHHDREFVDRLAYELVSRRVHIWLDRWELRVGDSLLDRIQAALGEASAILVVLSRASVASEWCRRELNAGLIRELEERRIVILPLLIEDCDIPLFLRDKYRADFRDSVDEGLRLVLEALAPVTNLYRARIESPEFFTDYAIDYFEGPYVHRRLTLVDHSERWPYSAITEISITGDDVATRLHEEYVAAGLEWWSDRLLIEALGTAFTPEFAILLEDHVPRVTDLKIQDARYGATYDVQVTCRLLGGDTGASVLLHLGQQVLNIIEDQRRASRPLTEEELARIAAVRARRGA